MRLLARAQTNFGVNKAYASVSTSGGSAGQSTANSIWQDFLTITETGKSGAGTFRYRFRVNGTTSGTSQMTFGVEHNGVNAALNNLRGNIFETGDLSFAYGQGISVAVRLSVTAANNGTPDFFNTAQLVATTPAGANGAQLTTVVPEASTPALALPALGMVSAVNNSPQKEVSLT